jgi:hypothetical protein
MVTSNCGKNFAWRWRGKPCRLSWLGMKVRDCRKQRLSRLNHKGLSCRLSGDEEAPNPRAFAMKHVIGLLLLAACTIPTGCAQGKLRKPAGDVAMCSDLSLDASSDVQTPAKVAPGERRKFRASVLALVEHQVVDDQDADAAFPEPISEGAIVDDKSRPEEVLPEPAAVPEFKPGAGEVDIDRFTRRVTEVPLDIRNTAGAMPEDVSVAAFPEAATPSVPGPAPGRVEVPVAYSPWTICFRPLYFEEVALERYGDTHGILQPAISGAHFFGSVVALPYKMTVRPPRSCECSNGFSRPGDCPLAGYGRHEARLDAALVEAAVIAGIAVALPW